MVLEFCAVVFNVIHGFFFSVDFELVFLRCLRGDGVGDYGGRFLGDGVWFCIELASMADLVLKKTRCPIDTVALRAR